MKSLIPSFAALALAATAVVWSCKPAESPGAAPAGSVPANLVLRTYDVPNDGAQQVKTVLKTVLWWGSDGKDSQKFVGRADVTPDGRLVVLATNDVQGGVLALIDSLAKSPPKPAASIELTYWLVLATPAGKSAPPPAGLQELAPALTEIEKADGPQQFSLAEKLSVSSISGEAAFVRGRDAQVDQVATAGANVVSAELKVGRNSNRVETRVKVAPGQIVVLGSSGATAKDKDDTAVSIYILIRAAIHDGQGR